MNTAEVERRLAILEQRAESAALEAEADEEYWSEVGTGQDTEEAEASGGLAGYAEGLRYALAFLRGEEEAGEAPTEARERLQAYRLDALLADGQISDKDALDALNVLLSAPEWPGASGMEDVCSIVRRTGREKVPDAPPWERH